MTCSMTPLLGLPYGARAGGALDSARGPDGYLLEDSSHVSAGVDSKYDPIGF